jgi:hypothetical protein
MRRRHQSGLSATVSPKRLRLPKRNDVRRHCDEATINHGVLCTTGAPLTAASAAAWLTPGAGVMTTRTDYQQIAAKLNYSTLEKTLETLRTQEPPKERKCVADVLAPITDKLRELRTKGWTYAQLTKELNDAGLPVKVSSLRAHLGTKTKRSKRGSISSQS